MWVLTKLGEKMEANNQLINRNVLQIGLGILMLFVITHNAEARDLVSAANSYTETAKNVAKAVGVSGMLVGAIMFAVPGVDRFATRVFLGGLFSVVITYGAPMIVSAANLIFGGL